MGHPPSSLLTGAFVLGCVLWASSAGAAVINVDPTVPDVLATGGVCSLREALSNASDDAATWPDCPAGTGDDRINLLEGIFQASSWLEIPSGNLSLVGLGPERTIIDSGCLLVTGAENLHVEGITIQNGTCAIAGATSGTITVHRTILRGTVLARCGRFGCPIPNFSGSAILGLGGTAEITDSAILDNEQSGLACLSGFGASCTVRNSTIAGNNAGAIGISSISHSTITNNGLGVQANSVLEASIVAGNGTDCAGPALTGGYNIDSDGTCGLTDPTDLSNTDPMLGPLQDNGGPTWTHALLPGSPAIDAIPEAECTWDDDGDPGTPEVPVATDQRGVPRPQLAACDIGAYEVTECADGANNDTDAFIDVADPGCRDAASVTESPQCQDGINNDPGEDGFIDFDGGLSVLGYAAAAPDPQCKDKPWRNCEWPTCCGLGFELALLLPGLMWLRRRRRQ